MPVPISFMSPLPASDLLFESMTLSAGLSVLDELQLGLVSARSDVKPADLLGKPVTVAVHLRDDAKRFFHGYVTRFGIDLRRGRHFGYRATVRSWLWFLTRTADCRIFHDATVPEIVKEVFGDHPTASFEFKLFRTYRQWVYCVQYRESDYNFVARLLEREGIYWYWEHGEQGSKLILVDSQSSHDAAPGCRQLPYYENAANVPPDIDCISDWRFASEVSVDRVATTSYDFERPSSALRVDATTSPGDGTPRLDVFDFQGDYVQTADGRQWVEDRLDQHQTASQLMHGASAAHGIEVGRLLVLDRHPREDQNGEYLVTGTTIHATVNAYETGTDSGRFDCEFTAIPSAQQFRPARRTPKPILQGPQTAVVIGPAGEEIHTDKYGRVKVQFHWDHRGKKDGKDACWVRVSHPWAGKNFGAMHVPRIGQEVVVGFLEGDPDQPLITGRVYNAEQMPPWDLPANATQSGILTRSSKGGSAANANAIRFEDKKGSEQLWIHAEKNQDIEVENDETHSVGHDRKKTVDHDETVSVKHDRTETVGNNETITVGVNRVEKVGSNETISIGANRTEQVGSNETIGIGANRTETVGANETISVGSNRTISVGGSETATVALQRTHAVGVNETIAIGAAQEVAIGGLQSVTVGAVQSISVGANQSNTIGANRTVKVGANQSETIGGDQSSKIAGAHTASVGKDRGAKVAGDDNLKVGKKLVVSAGDEISFTAGSASITLKKDGTIVIKGKDVTVDASGKVGMTAGSDVVLKGSKVLHN